MSLIIGTGEGLTPPDGVPAMIYESEERAGFWAQCLSGLGMWYAPKLTPEGWTVIRVR